jgi:hypothetical protein
MPKPFLTLIAFIFGIQASPAQDTLFMAPEGFPVFTWMDCETYSVFTHPDTAKITLKTTYLLDRSLLGQCAYSDYDSNTRHGKCIEYYEGGKTKYQAEFKEGMKHGNIISFYPDGQMKRQDYYRNDTLVSGWCYSPHGKREKHYPFEVRPEHPDGDEGFRKELGRKLDLMDEGIPVSVEFWVTREGQIRAAEAESENEEAAKMVEEVFLKLKPWRPGLRDGEADSFREFITLYLNPADLDSKDD